MQGQRQVLADLRTDHQRRALDDDPLARLGQDEGELACRQGRQVQALPVPGDQEVVRRAQGRQPVAEPFDEGLGQAFRLGGLAGDAVDQRQQVLGPVRQLAQDHLQMLLLALLLGDVHRGDQQAPALA